MRAIGVRKMELSGRFPLPEEARVAIDIKYGDTVEFSTESDYIVIDKFKERCVICEINGGIKNFKGKQVCKDCIEQLLKIK